MSTGYKPTRTKFPGVYYIMGTSRATGRPERIFYISYYINGKRVHLEKAGRETTDKMTAAKANQIRAEKQLGKILPNKEQRKAKAAEKAAEEGKWTFDRLWTEYNKQRRKGKPDPTDRSNYTSHISPMFGAKEPRELVPLDVDRLRMNLEKEEYHPATIARKMELLRRLSNFAVNKRLCAPLPFRVSLPKVDNQKTEDLNPEQIARLIRVLRGERLDDDPPDADTSVNADARDIMLMALYTGMRRGEIFKLTWDAVDFRRGFIELRTPKGGKSQTIPLNASAREVLKGRPRTDSEYVFPGRDGGKRTDAKKALEKIRERARLPKGFRPLHGLRHVFASHLASSGEVDLYTLQRLLTHKSSAMTMRYAHLRDDTLKRAAELAGRIVANVADVTEKKGGTA